MHKPACACKIILVNAVNAVKQVLICYGCAVTACCYCIAECISCCKNSREWRAGAFEELHVFACSPCLCDFFNYILRNVHISVSQKLVGHHNNRGALLRDNLVGAELRLA